MTEQLAKQLKEEGNALFAKKEYEDAHQKYSEAINHDKQNAILFANRAACSFAMGRYLDSAQDAREATRLDPSYPKAWARLANAQAALLNYVDCAASWETAIKALPTGNLTAVQQKQKQEYTNALRTAKETIRNLSNRVSQGVQVTQANDAPFIRAQSMLPGLRAQGDSGLQSSAWVAFESAKDFVDGVKAMKEIRLQGNTLVGNPEALTLMSTGLLFDHRAFHVDTANWLFYFNEQVKFEALRFGAIVDGTFESIVEAYRTKQVSDGWDITRPAMDRTIRILILRAFVEGRMKNNSQLAIELIRKALDILKWGNTGPWKDVSITEKGTIFQRATIHKAQVIFFELYEIAFSMSGNNDAVFPISKLYEEAKSLLADLDPSPPTAQEVGPGKYLAYYRYPAGHASSAIAFYHIRMAGMVQPRTLDNVKAHHKGAADHYLKAVEYFPIDDENHVYFLCTAVEHLFKYGTPVKEVLPLMERIRKGIPAMLKIWEHSGHPHHMPGAPLEKTLRVEDQIRDALKRGQFKPDDKIMPQWG
ncbi:TPR-like protein [Panus rudis PR-1116 ss-1]|nr:TPR-like protein [Panus rudis PR-1116 ss-1]